MDTPLYRHYRRLNLDKRSGRAEVWTSALWRSRQLAEQLDPFLSDLFCLQSSGKHERITIKRII